MNNEILKNAVAQVIKENGNEEITGNLLQQVLIAMINSLGLGFQFIGEAKPDTNPGTPDARVFYFAQDAGTYSNFDGLVLDGSSVAVFLWSNAWAHIVVNIPTTPGLDARYLRIANLASSTGESTTTAMTQKAVTDALAQMLESITTALTEKVDKEPGKGLSSNDYTTPEKQKLAALPTNAQLQETLNTKADKDTSAVAGNLAKFNADGNPVDSGISAADIITRQELNPNARRGLAEAVVDTDSEGTRQEFTFRQSGGDGGAFYRRILGKTLVWNQLVSDLTLVSGVYNGLTVTNNGDGTYTFNGTTTGTFDQRVANVNVLAGHKYFVRLDVPNVSANFAQTPFSLDANGRAITTPASEETRLYIIIGAGVTLNNVRVTPQVTDLTLMFSPGNEPSTVAEFEALYHGYRPFNPGALISNDAAAVKTVGFNLWDEEWEPGYYDASGNPVASNAQIRSKNLIPVFPSTAYYFNKEGNILGHRFCFYDANGNFLSRSELLDTMGFTTGNNVYFIKFHVDYSPASYDHDICINLSDPAKNGTYEPYWERVLPLGLSTMTGKLNGQGASVVVFPDGMNGVGSDYDEIRADGKTADKRRARIDLGSLAWSYISSGAGRFQAELLSKVFTQTQVATIVCPKYPNVGSASRVYSGAASIATLDGVSLWIHDPNFADAATFKAAMNGVYLDYPLATPETYVLDEPLPNAIKVDESGTEQAIQPENAALPSAPFSAIATYTMSIQRMVAKLRSL